ncbi:P-loop NTPase fold protein [Acetobacter thailandicus]|uniref:P-loop NTPase fold protein n=1 Tax=Acetobacter thailandicus TaxID=1502842 RepID=A0ABT3QDC7_9PROT|nr:P-loop NTPase fold protein [Acetobacter thailandicus]MCX2563298.1 P-loop NTPase fold protein [Acetobacter thailandicus]
MLPKADLFPDPNLPIIETLNDHADSDTPRDYSLLVDGPWGTGKTYLIKKFIEGRGAKEEDRPLYISLYGIKDVEELDSEILTSLYPRLNGKGARLASFVGKTLLKNVRIDLDDFKKGLTAGGGGIEIGGFKLLETSPKGRIIIFDDLERCAIPPGVLLGHIHQLIDDGKNRVILVANETEIAQDDSAALSEYKKAKEKTVGFSLTLQSDFNGAFSAFVSEMSDPTYRLFLDDAKLRIAELPVHTSEINLRVLKRAITAFEILFSYIDENLKKKKYWLGIQDIFLNVYMAFILTREDHVSIEVLNNEALQKERRYTYFSSRRHESTIATPLSDAMRQVRERYTFDFLKASAISFPVLHDLVCHNHVNPEALNADLSKHSSFNPPISWPAWRKLYTYWDLAPDEFVSALNSFKEDFIKRVYVSIDDILHSFSVYLQMKESMPEKFPLDDKMSQFTSYVDDVIRSKSELLDCSIDSNGDNENRSSSILGYQSEGHGQFSDEFAQAKEMLIHKIREGKVSRIAKNAEDFFDKTKDNPDLFDELLVSNASRKAPYARIPILAEIDYKLFSRHLVDLDPVTRKRFLATLFNRHDLTRNLNDEQIRKEKSWLDRVRTEMIDLFGKESIQILKDSYIDTVKKYINPCIPEMNE